MQFEIGNKVRNKANGIGIVEQLDPDNKDFAVLVRFKNKTLAWLSEKEIKLVEEPTTAE